MKLTYVWLMVIACFIQMKASTQELVIGDQCPDFPIKNILNYSNTIDRVDNYKGKVILIDFFATWCTSCVKGIPVADSLQQLFKNRIQFFLVSSEPREKVEKFLSDSPIGKSTKLPIVYNDSIFNVHFPHVALPHIAWLDKNGIVKAITAKEYVNRQNIEDLLDGKGVNWAVKRDIRTFDPNTPILTLNRDNIGDISMPVKSYHRTVTGFMDGLKTQKSENINTENNTLRVALINYPVIDLYLYALNKSSFYPKGFMLLDLQDKYKVVYDKLMGYKAEWSKKHVYSYEAVMPSHVTQAVKNEKIRDDLRFYLGIEAKIQDRTLKCLVLTRINTAIRLDSSKLTKEERKEFITVSDLLFYLNADEFGKPALNDTGLSSKIKLKLKKNTITDLTLLNMQIESYGLKMEWKHRTVEMVVFSDRL